jgi:hypothetical protein
MWDWEGFSSKSIRFKEWVENQEINWEASEGSGYSCTIST